MYLISSESKELRKQQAIIHIAGNFVGFNIRAEVMLD
jgi:hypothetical protein